VTLGERGALILDAQAETHVPAPQVNAIDTTGAGDAFCGSLAAQLARGRSLSDAVRDAVHVGAVSTTRHGALEALSAHRRVDRVSKGAARSSDSRTSEDDPRSPTVSGPGIRPDEIDDMHETQQPPEWSRR
jgi:bifunctional ADP-heptose synthase (sugar kinase/adenylyltransferase)